MDSDELGTVMLTVTIADWRMVIDRLDERCLSIVRAALEQGTQVSWLRNGEVSLLLSDDDEVRDLNGRYRGRDQPTNVLSFPNIELDQGKTSMAPPVGPVLLGDIAMSYQRLAAEAIERDKPVLDHFAHLLVHGVLHLLGHDHQEEEQAEMMEGLEEVILSSLGMAAPYQPSEGVVRLGALS